MAALSSEQQVIRGIRTKNGVEDDLLRRAREDPALGETINHLKDGYARALIMYVIICHYKLSVLTPWQFVGRALR